MFSKNVLFLQILYFQSILFLKTDEYELQLVSTTEIPSKSYIESHQVDLILEVMNEIKSQFEEMRKEISTLREHNIQTQLQKEKEHLTILKNQFDEFKNWSENSIQNQWQKFEQSSHYSYKSVESTHNVVNEIKSELTEMRKDILTMKENNNHFEQFKNWYENNIQTQWKKFEQKQKDQNNYTKTYFENSHNNLQKLIERMLENQLKQDNCVNEMKSQLETTRKKKFTLKKQNNQFDQYKKSLETKIDLLISHSDDTKTFMENVNNKLAELIPPKSCIDVQKSGKKLSGVYTIRPDFSPKSFDVWCDMETRGGGWIYVINRFDGSVNFNLSWNDYKNGFGNLNGEFWLGLEHLYLLTKSKPNELLIELVDQNLTKAYAHYKEFSIGDEGEGYPIKTIKDYSGDGGDSKLVNYLGIKFSTVDRDQDEGIVNCAKYFGGGFWYDFHCSSCIITSSRNTTITCHNSRGFKFYLKKVKMIIR